jgi:hypothetical protein
MCDDGSSSACPSTCIPERACAVLPSGGERCFVLDLRQPAVVASRATTLRSAAGTVIDLASPSFGTVERVTFAPPSVQFVFFPISPVLVRAFDADGDGIDEEIVGDFNVTFGLYRTGPDGIPEQLFNWSMPPRQGVTSDAAGLRLSDGEAVIAGLHSSGNLLLVRDVLGVPQVTELATPGTMILPVPLYADAGSFVVGGGVTGLFAVRLGVGDTSDTTVEPLSGPDGEIADFAVSDVDADGTADLVVLVRAPDQLVWMSIGDGSLGAAAVLSDAPGADHVAAGDIDGDGLADLLTAAQTGDIVLHLAAEAFAASTPVPGAYRGTRPMLADLDGDGDLDVTTAGGFFNGRVSIWLSELL